MSSHWKTVVIAGLVLGLGLPVMADPRPKGAVPQVEVDENGLPFVKVRLSSKMPGVPDREFRFMFDTGATVDGTGSAIAIRIVCLKRHNGGMPVRPCRWSEEAWQSAEDRSGGTEEGGLHGRAAIVPRESYPA
jgi:hypothetical protein